MSIPNMTGKDVEAAVQCTAADSAACGRAEVADVKAIKANLSVTKELLQMCDLISEHGSCCEEDSWKRKLTFGRLTEFHSAGFTNNNIVAMLLRARKWGLVEFSGETLYQPQNNDTVILLAQKISHIRNNLKLKITELEKNYRAAMVECKRSETEPTANWSVQDKIRWLEQRSTNMPQNSCQTFKKFKAEKGMHASLNSEPAAREGIQAEGNKTDANECMSKAIETAAKPHAKSWTYDNSTNKWQPLTSSITSESEASAYEVTAPTNSSTGAAIAFEQISSLTSKDYNETAANNVAEVPCKQDEEIPFKNDADVALKDAENHDILKSKAVNGSELDLGQLESASVNASIADSEADSGTGQITFVSIAEMIRHVAWLRSAPRTPSTYSMDTLEAMSTPLPPEDEGCVGGGDVCIMRLSSDEEDVTQSAEPEDAVSANEADV